MDLESGLHNGNKWCKGWSNSGHVKMERRKIMVTIVDVAVFLIM